MLSSPAKPRLGVNIDHVATLRRLRDTPYPRLTNAAREVVAGGADQITIHLREDRRHIVDGDLTDLKAMLTVDLNLELAATPEMLRIALELKPYSICVVPEKREERTTEGGLDLSRPESHPMLREICSRAHEAGILVSFFVEPDAEVLAQSKALGAQAVELHTGTLCIAFQQGQTERFEAELARLQRAITAGHALGLMVNAGHGIDYELAPRLARLGGIQEYNIGHSIVCEAVFTGIRAATERMKALLHQT